MEAGIRTVSGKKLTNWILVVGLLTIVFVTVTFRLVGFNRFVNNSYLVEGKNNSVYLSRAIAACAEKKGALPPSSPKVPAELSAVGGKTYLSTEQDWQDEAFRCDGFHLSDPQRFQYEWERTSDTEGIARAQADFDGNGVVEARYEQEVKCAKKGDRLVCGPGAFYDRNH